MVYSYECPFYFRYECITLPKIKVIPIPDLASPGALVIVWVTNKTKIMDFVREELFPTWNVNQIGEWHWCKVFIVNGFGKIFKIRNAITVPDFIPSVGIYSL